MYVKLLEIASEKTGQPRISKLTQKDLEGEGRAGIIPASKERYLSDVADTCREYRREVQETAEAARKAYAAAILLADEHDRDELDSESRRALLSVYERQTSAMPESAQGSTSRAETTPANVGEPAQPPQAPNGGVVVSRRARRSTFQPEALPNRAFCRKRICSVGFPAAHVEMS